MQKSDRLQSATPEEKEAFKKAGITTATALWSRVGKDGIDAVAKDIQKASGLPISPTRLEALLATQLQHEIHQENASWLTNNWQLAAICLLATVLLFLMLRVLVARDTVVVTTRPLPPYHLITSADVDTIRERPWARTFQAERQVVGRYTLKALPHDKRLHADHISDFQLSGDTLKQVSAWPILVFTVTSPTAVLASPNTRVQLLFASYEAGKTDTSSSPLLVRNAFVIATLGGEVPRVVAAVDLDSHATSLDRLQLLRRIAQDAQVAVLHPSQVFE